MDQTPLLTFTDEQLLAALKVAPSQTQAQVHIIAMQTELAERRAVEDDDDGS